MAYKFQIGDALVSGSLTRDAGDIKVRNHANREIASISRAGVISGSGEAAFGSIDVDGVIDAGGYQVGATQIISSGRAVSNVTSVAMGGALSGVTSLAWSGAASGSQGTSLSMADAKFTVSTAGALVAASLNNSAGGITNAGAIAGATTIDASGDLTVGTITNAEFTVDASGNTDIDGTLNVEGVPTFQAGAVFSGGITTAGALAGATTVSGSGLAQFGQVRSDGGLTMQGSTIISAAKAVSNVTSIDGTGDLTMATITMTGFTVDADGDTVAKSLAWGGAPLSGAFGSTMTLADAKFLVSATGDLTNSGFVRFLGVGSTDTALDVANDGLYFRDANDSDKVKQVDIDSFLADIAGAGLTVSSNQLATQAGAVSASSDTYPVLTEGYNYLTGTAGASLKLPIDASIGDVIHVKNSSAGVCNISKQSNHTIDGLTGISLESSRGAVSMVYALTSSWLLV